MINNKKSVPRYLLLGRIAPLYRLEWSAKRRPSQCLQLVPLVYRWRTHLSKAPKPVQTDVWQKVRVHFFYITWFGLFLKVNHKVVVPLISVTMETRWSWRIFIFAERDFNKYLDSGSERQKTRSKTWERDLMGGAPSRAALLLDFFASCFALRPNLLLSLSVHWNLAAK